MRQTKKLPNNARIIPKDDILKTFEECSSIHAATVQLRCGREALLRNIKDHGLMVPAKWSQRRIVKLIEAAICEAGSYRVEDVMYALGDILPEDVQDTLRYSEVARIVEELWRSDMENRVT